MISLAQIERAAKEFETLAVDAFEAAKIAERELERYTYTTPHQPMLREKFLHAFMEADYMAESRAFIRELIRKEMRALKMPINGELPAMPCDPGDTVVPGGIER